MQRMHKQDEQSTQNLLEVENMEMIDIGLDDRVVKISVVICIGTAFFVSLICNAQLLAGVMDVPSEGIVYENPLDRLRYGALQDAVPFFQEYYGYTPVPEYQPLEVHESDNPAYEYMAVSPYYKVYFKGNRVRMSVKNEDTWIEYELEYITVMEESEGEQLHSEVVKTPSEGESVLDQNMLSICDVFESVSVSYTADTSLLTEALVLEEQKQCTRIVQKIEWEGITPEYQEDGSILFLDEIGEKIVEILPPFMKDAEGVTCSDVHYELLESESGYELHKVIGEEGLEWLQEAVYPVAIDPTMQTFEDAWESSGLQPYGQYFRNLREYINPASGYLTIAQTDLVIPGRGFDLAISRVYETPAVFYGSDPYDFEAPPTDVGKGWQLDFPYIGTKYVHLWSGTLYKIVWSGNQFTHHTGNHFTLVKNGDNTYTLTTSSGTVYEFNTSGKVTQIKDIDLNTITFTYTDGDLTTITDTIGRTVSLSYSNDRLWKITYNSAELEYSYDANGCLVWMEDFLDRRTSYSYDTGYNNWLLSKIEYPTAGYTTYAYNRFSDSDYYRYYVTDQRVYETNQVRHAAYSYTGTFEGITSSTVTMKNESDVTQGSYELTTDDLVTQKVVKNAASSAIRKYVYTYNSQYELAQESVYKDGSTLSYTNYYAYDDWGNLIYFKNALGHEQFFSYANTSTSGFFMDNTGAIIRTFTNAFSNSTIPSSVHTVLIGMVEEQDNTYVKERYLTYDSEAHPTQTKNSFGNTTTWLTFSGTFNENTGTTSFPVDLTGYTVAGNAVLQITGLASDPTYSEMHSYTPSYGSGCQNATWTYCGWQSDEYKTKYTYICGVFPDIDTYEGWAYIGPFAHYPGTLGYQSSTTNPSCNQQSYSFAVTAYWKAYPAQVQYDINGSNWKPVSSNLKNTTAQVTAPGLANGQNTLYFSESSSQQTKFSWYLYVPVDNTPTTYTTSMQYDSYGNVTTITDSESNTVSFTYSSSYSYAYLTEISATVGNDTITTKATYDYYHGWTTSIQQPKGVDSGSGYDILYTYDALGRITKKEFPLLSGQSERSYIEAVYDCENSTTTFIDQLGHYIVYQYDKLGRHVNTKWYTGTYGSGTLYATISYAYRFDNLVATTTDQGNHTTTYTYDFLGRQTQISYPGSTSVSYSYDDTNNKVTFTNARNFDTLYWYDWLNRLTKVESEYVTDSFAATTYQYDKVGHLTSVTDAESHTTTFTYTSFFGLTRTTYPDSEYEQYAYDNVGNITLFTDNNGNETSYTYDDIYRLTQIEYEDQSTVSFTYDLNSNRTRMDDDAPNTGDYVEYAYDCWNRPTTKTRHISTNTYTFSHEYDEASRLEKLTYPDNMEILYSYDDLGRMTEIKRYVDGSNDEILMDGIQYNTENFLTQYDFGNDLRATFSYDSRDRLLTLDLKNGATSFLDLDYTYDNNGNITQLVNGWRDTDSDWNSDTESYSYDGLERLTSASCTGWSHTYSYDKVSNITSKDSVNYTINTVNEVTSLSDGTSFVYDSNGSRTQKTKGTDTWDYTYDYANRLIKLEKNDTTIGEYVYDGEGRRLQATENSVTTTYIYDGSEIKYEENTNSTTTYIYGPTGRLARRTTINQVSNTYYYHIDHLSSTRLVTDTSKNIVVAATYHPFGALSTIEGLERYLYTGKEKDSSGLYYYGARYYDLEIDRFLTRDPYTSLPDDPRTIGSTAGAYAGSKNPRTLNRYSYAGNNPLKFNDPTGLCFNCAEMRYELTRENSLDLIEDWWELISMDLSDYFGMIFSSLGVYLGAPSPGFGGMCYYVAVQVCVDKVTGEVTEKRQRPPCWYDTEDSEAKEQCYLQADGDRGLAEFFIPETDECQIIIKEGCEGEGDSPPTETPDQTDPPVGPCIGTSLLGIFLGVTILTTSLRRRREMNQNH